MAKQGLFLVVIEAMVVFFGQGKSYFLTLLLLANIPLLIIVLDIFRPSVILKKEGIFVSRYGFINWSEIRKVEIRHYGYYMFWELSSQHGESRLVINLKDPGETIKKLSFLGKLTFAIQMFFGAEPTVHINTWLLSKSATELLDIIETDYLALSNRYPLRAKR
jgi:uncharacterized membrane protein YobD (UPF0266 family)